MKKEKSGKPDIMEFAGILSEEEGEGIKKEMRKFRERFNAAYEERQKALDKGYSREHK